MTTSTASSSSSYYCKQKLPPHVIEQLEAGAFQSLCQHLQERSDTVQNMDLMTLSGFCRNCLAKWMVLRARQLVDESSTSNTNQHKLSPEIIQALNQMGYAEAAEHVYGISYEEWKKRHQIKATEEQLKQYQDSTHLHAQHDTKRLEKRTTFTTTTATTTSSSSSSSIPLASNVCCQAVDIESNQPMWVPQQQPKDDRLIPPFTPPSIPYEYLPDPIHIAVLTISDRASKGTYLTGDLSGPAVVESVQDLLNQHESQIIATAIVPDDKEQIQNQLNSWKDQVHLVLTTGGTGFSQRDVTPEATKEIITTELPGLMTFVSTECSRFQPLSSLSRGTVGILGSSTVVANLPGNPKGVQEMMPILLPLLLHVVVELQE